MSTVATAPASQIRSTLNRKRVYIFPTKHGLMLGAMVFVILLGSVNYDNALGYLLAFLLFGIFLIGVLHTYRNLTGLSHIAGDAQPVFAGSDATFKLAIENTGGWQRYNIHLSHWPRLSNHWWRRRRAVPHTEIASIEPGSIATMNLTLATANRGVLPLARVRIASVFPLGILRAWGYFETPLRCLVYPQSIGSLAIPLDTRTIGQSNVGVTQGNDDFAGFRPYHAGDPVRTIAWKNLAKQDTVLVKRFTGGGSAEVRLRWADTAVMGNTEARLCQLSQWIVEAERLGLDYALELPELTIEPNSGGPHRHACLSALALF
ncbi:MAG: hypothetical protein ACI9BW_000800 [Gammaproteobacteria bacterium]